MCSLGYHSSEAVLISFETGSLTGTWRSLIRLREPWGGLLSFPSQGWDYKYVPGGPNSCLPACPTGTY